MGTLALYYNCTCSHVNCVCVYVVYICTRVYICVEATGQMCVISQAKHITRFVCVCVHVLRCVGTGMYESVCGSQRLMSEVSLSCSPHYILKQGVPQNPELIPASLSLRSPVPGL